ncbi:hypothetical protein T01_3423 [Trichinella spiralis]|uniref:Uncharacterized protein n=1 Tax=Trichinella spiralis TaxID=6334 RepID=A0A0V1BUC2_TRISP|nr:hypothetical protein T01_3423 [Trichinella spiralis]
MLIAQFKSTHSKAEESVDKRKTITKIDLGDPLLSLSVSVGQYGQNTDPYSPKRILTRWDLITVPPVSKNHGSVLYACDAQYNFPDILLGQPNVGSQEDGRVGRMPADRIRNKRTFVLFDIRQSEECTLWTAANRVKLEVGVPGGWPARTANGQLAHCGGACSFDLAMVIWRSRPDGCFSRYFIGPLLALWRKYPLSLVQRSSGGRFRGLSTPNRCRQTPGERSGQRCAGIVLALPVIFGHQPMGRSHRRGRCRYTSAKLHSLRDCATKLIF